MKNEKLIVVVALATALVAGCVPPNIPDIKTIEPSETAFLIPLEGQTSSQASFDSEKFLEDSKVATKRVSIPKRWRSTGRLWFSGEYIPTVRLIVVDRKPEARNWDTENKNPIVAESKESIGFQAGMACTAQIDEVDAARFLYRYNNKTLDQVMDQELLTRVRTKFVENCSKYNLIELQLHKKEIMDAVRADVEPYFKDRGVTITALGLMGEFKYISEAVQTAINLKFEVEQERIAQIAINDKHLSKAKTDNEVSKLMNNTNALKLRELELQARFIDKWDGKAPNAIGNSTLFSVPFATSK